MCWGGPTPSQGPTIPHVSPPLDKQLGNQLCSRTPELPPQTQAATPLRQDRPSVRNLGPKFTLGMGPWSPALVLAYHSSPS